MSDDQRDTRQEMRQDLDATVEARRELGPAYEDDLVASFVDRVDASVRERVDAELARRPAESSGEDESRNQRFALGIVSLGTGIPITAIAGGVAETAGVVLAWAGIVGVNVAFAWGNRRR